jgi:hypothetical protein
MLQEMDVNHPESATIVWSSIWRFSHRMKLTAGTTLQGNKYVVQEIVSQNEQGLTCKATHTYLDHPVILQTFHPALQQRDDFTQLKQQFVARVRSLVHQPAQPSNQPAIQVLDYFEEDGLPVLVLKGLPTETILKDGIWSLVLATAAPTPSSADKSLAVPLIEHNLVASNPVEDAVTVRSGDSRPAVVTAAQPTEPAAAAENDRIAGVNATEPVLVPPLSPSDRSSTYEPIIFRPSPTPSARVQSGDRAGWRWRRPKFPVALMVIAVTSGLIGVGSGLALRFAASAPSKDGKSPRLSFFQREQTFPATGGWPVQERAIYTPPEVTIEQPLYRAAPPSEYSTPYLPPSSIDSPAPSIEVSPSVEPQLPDVAAPPLKAEPKPPLESAPPPVLDLLPELNRTDIPADSLPSTVDSLPPMITEPPAPVPLPESNFTAPSIKPLPGNSSRIISQ